MNRASFEPYKNNVTIKTIRIESHHYFLQQAQVSDYPKERSDES